MAAEVDGDGLPPALGDSGGSAGPRPPGLATAVQEDHGAGRGIAHPVGDDADSAGRRSHERLRRFCHPEDRRVRRFTR